MPETKRSRNRQQTTSLKRNKQHHFRHEEIERVCNEDDESNREDDQVGEEFSVHIDEETIVSVHACLLVNEKREYFTRRGEYWQQIYAIPCITGLNQHTHGI